MVSRSLRRDPGLIRVSISSGGAQTDACIDTTCRSAFGRGYRVVLVSDCHSTFDLGDLTARQIINHHNAILYGEFVTLVPAAKGEFAAS